MYDTHLYVKKPVFIINLIEYRLLVTIHPYIHAREYRLENLLSVIPTHIMFDSHES